MDKDSRAVFITVTVTFLIASVFAAGRVISRFGILKRHSWDDYAFIVAWILAFGLSFTVVFRASKGFGLYADDSSRDTAKKLLQTQYAAIVMFIPALMAAKISILLLYLDIARHSQTFLRVGSYITLAVVSVGGCVLTLMTALRCHPVQAAYNLAAEDPRCIPIQTIWLTAWPINIATELAILVLPIPALATLPLTRLRKAAVMLSFILGVIFIGVIDVARIYKLQLAALDFEQAADLLLLSPNLSSNANMALLWSAVEVNAAILGAAIPTLAPVMKRLTPSSALLLASCGSTRTFLLLFSPERESANSPALNASQRQNSQASTTPAITGVRDQPMNGRTIIPAEYTESTARSPVSHSTQEGQDSVYFGFINPERAKCIVDTCGSESVKYCAIVDLLLFFNGFIYVMLFSLNASIPIVKTRAQAVGMASASYVGGGILSPCIGYASLRHLGLNVTIASSLAFLCIGTLIFWPCGAVGSYPGFVVCTALVGASLSIIEIAADTFNSLCGPPEYTEVRVLLGLGVQGIGGTLSSVLAENILTADVEESHSLVALQWTYLILALCTVLLGLLYWHLPLPQPADPGLRTRPEILLVDPRKKHFNLFPVTVTSLGVAVLSGFCSAGALTSLRHSISNVLSSVSTKTKTAPNLAISDFQTSLSAVYACGHFLFAALCLFIPPRMILLGAYGAGITLAVVLFSVQFPSAASVQQVTFALSLFSGPIPNLVIAIAIRGLGWRTALACCLVFSGCALGACIWPWVTLAVSSSKSAQYTFCVLVVLFIVGSFFPVYLNVVRSTHGREQPPGWKAITTAVQGCVL